MLQNHIIRRWICILTLSSLWLSSIAHPSLAMQTSEFPEPLGDDRRELPCVAPAEFALEGRWIEVSLNEQLVRLCQGPRAWREYIAATGIGDRPKNTTYPGLFTVYQKNMGPFLLPEYGVYVSHWVAFDEEHDNGFHSLPMDRWGRVLDSRLGRAVSHGCIRTGNPAAIFEFAEFGMQVWVH